MIGAALPAGLLVPLANHAPDGLGLALLLYFGPVVALVGFLVFLSRRGRSKEVEQARADELSAGDQAPASEETPPADDPSSSPSPR